MGDIPVIIGDEFGVAPEIELGKADKVLITSKFGTMPVMPLVMGSMLKYENAPVKIFVEGWKTPAQAAGFTPTVFPSASGGNDEEILNLKIILCSLVRMMGGAVTISEAEAVASSKLDIDATDIDFAGQRSLVITVKDKQ